MIFVKDAKNLKFELFNHAGEMLLGQKRKDFYGKSDYDFFPKNEANFFIKKDRETLNNKKLVEILEEPIKTSNGIRFLHTKKIPLYDENGKPEFLLGISEDITERKKLEEKLKNSMEDKYRKLFESARESILILDWENGEITDSNPFVQTFLGYSADELIGKKIFEITPLNDIIKNKERFNELKEKGYAYYDNLSLETKFGEKKHVEFISNVYLVGDKKVIQCNIRDITERFILDEAKSGFLSIASHQLRTPLSMTKWVLESLIQQGSLNLKQQSKLNDLVYSNERLIKLVNDLLNVSTIDTGKLEINKKEVDILKLVNDSVESIKAFANKKQKEIKIIAPENIKNVNCDPVLVSEALENLLTNAVNYSLIGSKEIKITINDRSEDYMISVHNAGSIEKSVQEKIKKYDKFVRGANAPGIQPTGSGLGLYITKKVIEANGGSIWFESSAKDGTTFYLTIIKSKLK